MGGWLPQSQGRQYTIGDVFLMDAIKKLAKRVVEIVGSRPRVLSENDLRREIVQAAHQWLPVHLNSKKEGDEFLEAIAVALADLVIGNHPPEPEGWGDAYFLTPPEATLLQELPGYRVWRARLPSDEQAIVILTAATYEGARWIHVSMSVRGVETSRMPTWPELVAAKELTVGTELHAYAVCPPRDKYVNIHKNTLHLWCSVDGPRLPDFTRGGSSI